MKKLCIFAVMILLLMVQVAHAADWPEFGGNAERTATTEETLSFPLTNVWKFDTGHAPSPAFREGVSQSRPRYNTEAIKFDYVYHPVVADGCLFFSSSTEESVTCLDAGTGEINWVFYTDSAVRTAPSVSDGRVYFGSDDGHAYCLNVADGSEVWSFDATLGKRWVPGNRRMMSLWPVRAGVSVRDGVAYFGAGILSEEGIRLYARNAATGAAVWQAHTGFVVNGPMLFETNSYMEGTSLIVPSGRNTPVEYDPTDGSTYMGASTRRAGGGAAVWKMDGKVVFGPTEYGHMMIRADDDGTDNGEQAFNGLITLVEGIQLVCNSNQTFRLDEEELCAYSKSAFNAALADSVSDGSKFRNNHITNPFQDRYGLQLQRWVKAESNKLWSVSLSDARAMVRAGDALIVGLDGAVQAYRVADGSSLWSEAVDGEVWSLAVADGALYASTDEGILYGFKTSGSFTDRSPVVSNPYAAHAIYEEAAELIAQEAEHTNGYCLVLGAGADDGQLAYEIARQTGFAVIGVESSASKAATARAKLSQAGVYGSRVTIHQISGDAYPYADSFANVIISADALNNGSTPHVPNEILRMLRPYGGLILMGTSSGSALDLSGWQHDELSSWTALSSGQGAWWRTASRGAVIGAGEWTHHYGNIENTSCSNDELVSDKDLVTQWFGGPGANDVIDRHDLGMPPLFKNGYLLIAGLEQTFSLLDPYNGTERWKITIPSTTRKQMPLINAFMCMDDHSLYAASSNTCSKVRLTDGSSVDNYAVPDSTDDWGFIAVDGDRLYGSTQKPEASYNAYHDMDKLINQTSDSARPVISSSLFALNPTNGATLWKYDNNSAIINSSIAVGDSKLFFIESTASAVVNDADACVDLMDFYAAGARMVALNVTNGTEIWSESMGQVPDSIYDHIAYLSFHSNVLLCTRGFVTSISGEDRSGYQFTGIDPDTHTNIWQQTRVTVKAWQNTLKGTKSQAVSHPTLMNGRLYHLAYWNGGIMHVFDVKDGTDYSDTGFGKAWENKGCAMRPASSTTMYHRHTVTEAYNPTTKEKSYISTIDRPSCWMSVIPAGGLVLMPEGGSGCDCGITLQLSLAKADAAADTVAPALLSASAPDSTHVVLTFSEGVDRTTAENKNNYDMDGGITVSAATRMTDHPERVELTVSPMVDGTYDVTTENVEDIYGNALLSDDEPFDVAADTDSDGLPDSWEATYYGGATNAVATNLCANGLNTLLEAYIAGLNPTNPDSFFTVDSLEPLQWTAVSGRYYNVYWTSNLLSDFTPLGTNLTDGSFTDLTHSANGQGFYKIDARLEL